MANNEGMVIICSVKGSVKGMSHLRHLSVACLVLIIGQWINGKPCIWQHFSQRQERDMNSSYLVD